VNVDARTELIEAIVFVSIHVEVTVRLFVLLEVFDPLVERPRDVFLRRPIKAKGIEGRLLTPPCQLLPDNHNRRGATTSSIAAARCRIMEETALLCAGERSDKAIVDNWEQRRVETMRINVFLSTN
jgi:hypothetical protein